MRHVKAKISQHALQTVSFWQFFKAKRYHVLTFRIIFRTTLFCGAIFGCITLGDYIHAHPLTTLAAGAGFLRYVDRSLDVLTDCLCDRIFPGDAGAVGSKA